MFPVKSGDTWKVTGNPASVFWIPIIGGGVSAPIGLDYSDTVVKGSVSGYNVDMNCPVNYIMTRVNFKDSSDDHRATRATCTKLLG